MLWFAAPENPSNGFSEKPLPSNVCVQSAAPAESRTLSVSRALPQAGTIGANQV